MSGIFLFFDPSGISGTRTKAFKSRLTNRISRMPDQKIDVIQETRFIGASSHHGVFPSGGIATIDNSDVLSTGSCWIENESDGLASPERILSVFNKIPNPARPIFHGSFALAFHNRVSNVLTVESDRWAAYPLYFRILGQGVAVSTSLKFLVDFGNEEVNKEAITEFLTLGYMGRSHTFIKNINILPVSSRLVFDQNGLKITQFPNPVYSRKRPFDNDGIDEYDTLIKQYMGRFKNCTPNFCISMSGGLDSRLVGAAALRSEYSLSGFTIGEKNSLEVSVASDACSILKIPLKIHEVDGSTFPGWFNKTVWFTEGRVLPLHMHYMSAQFSAAVPSGPQLSGLVGEAVLGGHFDNPDFLNASSAKIREGCQRLVTSALYYPNDSQHTVLSSNLIDGVPGLENRIAEDLLTQMNFQGTYSDYVNFKNQLKGNGFMNPCILSQILPWSDVINPFLDPEAFDLGASFSLDGIAARSGQIKWGLRHLPDIAKLPRLKAGVMIDINDSDPRAYNRGLVKLMRKGRIAYLLCRLSGGQINMPMPESFPYYGSWYRRFGPVRDYIDGVLLSEQTLDRGLFKREGLRCLLHDLRIGRNTWAAVGSCLMLEVFLRQFIDGTDQPEDTVTPLGYEYPANLNK